MATTEQIQLLADLSYAAQTTGVSSAEYAAATQAVGIDPDDYMARQEFLQSYGYQPGTGQFYENSTLNTAPIDAALAAHYNAEQTAINEYGYLESTEENIANYAGKINPETGEPYKFIVNDSAANAQFIENYLNANNLDAESTVARAQSNLDRYQMEYNNQTGGAFDMDNSLQWADLGKKKLD